MSFINFFSFDLFARPIPESGVIITLLVILNIIWAISLIITLALSKHIASTIITVAAPAVIVVLAGQDLYGALGGAVLLAFTLIASRRSFREEITNRIEFKPYSVFRYGTRFVIIGLILALAGLLLPEIRESVSQEGIKVSEKQISVAIKPIEPLIEDFAPGVSTTGTVDDFIDSQIEEQIGQLPEGVTISEEQRQQLRQEIARQFNQPITGRETLASVMTNKINQTLQNITQGNALIVALVIIILAFLTLRAFVPMVSWLIIGIIYLVIIVGKKAGLFLVTEKTATIKHLEL